MTVIWQITELSTKDDEGDYIDDISSDLDLVFGFAFDQVYPGDPETEVTITSATATWWRYLQPHEITGPTVSRREQIGDVIIGAIEPDGDSATFVVPKESIELDQFYQLRIVATPVSGSAWVRTRDYRCVT